MQNIDFLCLFQTKVRSFYLAAKDYPAIAIDQVWSENRVNYDTNIYCVVVSTIHENICKEKLTSLISVCVFFGS